MLQARPERPRKKAAFSCNRARKRKSPTGKTHGTCTPFDLGERTACIELQSLNSHSKITIVSFPLLTIRNGFIYSKMYFDDVESP